VALARAVYSGAQVLLLDDPLSAVDAHVGQALFEGCIGNPQAAAGGGGHGGPLASKPPLLAGTTRVLVTHHVQYLRRCDQVLVMDKGSVVASGSFDDLLAAQVPAVLEVVDAEHAREAADQAAQAAQAGGALRTAPVVSARDKAARDQAGGKASGRGGSGHGGRGEAGALILKEERAVGAVPVAAYAYYARAGGWGWVGALAAIALCGRGCEVGSTFWLARWAEESLAATEAFADGITASALSFLT
jgi:hypothetical protein